MMKLHEIQKIENAPFRKMRVESGHMYNAWNDEKQDWDTIWTFVPQNSERISKLEHHEATTVGLWATDRPDLVDDPEDIMFQITKSKFDDFMGNPLKSFPMIF